ncbi:MAG: hypothetical protein ABIO55_17345 [Ginsengibacter sp.]
MYNKQSKKFLLALLAPMALIISSAVTHKQAKVIQINVSEVLNTRSVTTLKNKKLTTWTTGIDRDNGYLTMAAASFMGDHDPHALPDNSLFPANQSHPEILLHYSNKAISKNQTRCIPDSGEFVFKVPNHKYSDLYVSVTSSYGTSSLGFELTYADGVESKTFILPDWFKDIPENDPDFSYVAHNMGKWGDKNILKEKDHHNIDALNIHPNPDRVLKNVKLKKLPGGYLVFWAATGVVKY